MENNFIELLINIPDWLHPEYILKYGGVALLLTIIFLESGIIFGFIFPGDSLLFSTGLLISTGWIKADLTLLIIAIIISGLLGTISGYFTGIYMLRILPRAIRKYISRKRFIERTGDFYARFDSLAFIAGRYVPVIRTFIPILAGMVKLSFRRFILLNITGLILWVIPMVLSGFFLGEMFPRIFEEFEMILLTIICVAYLPVIFVLFIRKKLMNKY